MVVTKLLSYVLPILFITFMLYTIGGFFLAHKLLLLLKENHFEKWKELGSPTLVMNNSIKNNLAMWAFIKNKEYLELNDPWLTKMCQSVRIYGIIYLLFFILIVFLTGIEIYKSRIEGFH